MSMKRAFVFLFVPALFSVFASAAGAPRLFQHPTVSQTRIVFAFGGDLWSVGRQGGTAERLTASPGTEKDPFFSPDGSLIAFTGEYDGNVDVFVIPAAGGIPRRLTFHPGPDEVVGWTPDGKRIIFRSSRNNSSGVFRLFTVGLDGGYPQELPLPTAVQASFSAAGDRLAYVPTQQWQAAWKRYRGGQTTPIWLISLADLKVEKVPRENSDDSSPMWIGDQVYFLSDRKGPVALYVYDTATKNVSPAVLNAGLDFKSASAGPGAIVYEQFGSLHLFDLASGREHAIDVTLNGDFPEVRPHYVPVGRRIEAAAVSPSGARAVFEARGEILTVPADKGDIRNLTRTTGVMERDPAWSPDGKSIAYFSDASGEYALHIIDQAGKGPAKVISLGERPSFYYRPLWSPDSRKIAYNDKHLTLWFVDVEKGRPAKIDETYYFNPTFAWDFAWSPDSRWLTYNKQIRSHMNVVMVYSLETGRASQVTDGLSDARFPVFDKSGKYLFFTASTDVGLTPGWLNMSSMDRPVTRSVYVAVLRKDLPSPLAPESDEEKAGEAAKADKAAEAKKSDDKAAAKAEPAKTEAKEEPKAKEPERVVIDFEGIGQRILALPIPVRNYVALVAGKEGFLYLQEAPLVMTAMLGGGGGGLTLHKFDLAQRKIEKFIDNVGTFDLSANGEKILYAQGGQWIIGSATGPTEPGKGVLKTGAM